MSESSSYFDLAGRLEKSFAEIEDTITVDLRENDEDYRSLYQSISDLKAKYPFIQTVIEGAGGSPYQPKNTKSWQTISSCNSGLKVWNGSKSIFEDIPIAFPTSKRLEHFDRRRHGIFLCRFSVSEFLYIAERFSF